MTDLELARECGAIQWHEPSNDVVRRIDFTPSQLATFAQRIRQEEREACMAECTSVRSAYEGDFDAQLAATDCAAAIRNRGQEGASNG